MERRKRVKYRYIRVRTEHGKRRVEGKNAVMNVIVEGYSACPSAYRLSGVRDLDLGSSSDSSSAVRYEAFVSS